MNTLNLTKRPMITVPETAEGMVNLLLTNSLDQLGIEQDKAEHWEQKYLSLRKFCDDLEKITEIGKYTDGSLYIRFDCIGEKYDSELFDNVASILKLGKKIIEFQAKEE